MYVFGFHPCIILSSCIRICIDVFHVILWFYLLYIGKGTDEASSDIDRSLEKRETMHLDENGDHKLSQPVKHQKMSEEESTEVKVTTCM